MSDVVRIEGSYYIRAGSGVADGRTHVLKHDGTFGVFDRFGDVQPVGVGEHGLFHFDTRHLSHLVLRVAGVRPMVLNSRVLSSNATLAVDLANPDVAPDGGPPVPRETVHVFRSKFLHRATCYEKLRLTNFGGQPIALALTLTFAADFADMFEVRGTKRARRGTLHPPEVQRDRVRLAYDGLDGVHRTTTLAFRPTPERLAGDGATYTLHLGPGQSETLELTVTCAQGVDEPAPASAEAAWRDAERALRHGQEAFCHVETSNAQFDAWVRRAVNDLRMMISETPQGMYPAAGVPWFSTPFGRDGILTALAALWIHPRLARGVLGFLAAHQARHRDPEKDAEPGKILHETRDCEMARTGEVPFRGYYGSVDATPLFVVLAGEYARVTDDRGLVATLWPAIERAMAWVDGGLRRGGGFLTYQREGPKGLVHQGWKDSDDSVFHADGGDAPQPIALCEVQAYVYGAKRAAARMAAQLGHHGVAARQQAEARELRERFDAAFWCEDLACYALALDGQGQPCRVRTSNAGHCLLTGIVPPARAGRLADTLLSDPLFSGWGVRTLASNERRYNPMSYHNGSVWPHDSALVAEGLARQGFKAHAARILTGLFEASLTMDLHRLPELFCGFRRRPEEGPTLYPVACSPQSWAAASVFLLLKALLGLDIDAAHQRVSFQRPVLPPFLDEVRLYHLQVGSGEVDLVLHRYEETVGVEVARRSGAVEVATLT